MGGEEGSVPGNGTDAVDPTLADGERVSGPSIVFVGLMGAGKTSIGRRVARRLPLPFADADEEIERAAGASVADIFERYGEAEFRRLERAVIARLLDGPPTVISTGGGAFVDPSTRDLVRQSAISVWLRASLDVLVERTSRRDTRPLLRGGDPRAVLADLMAKRHPIYAEADIVVDSADAPRERTVDAVLAALSDHQKTQQT